MHRFFTEAVSNGEALVTGEDVRHITRVLRLKKGDAATLCDGMDTDYDGIITGLSDGVVRFAVSEGRPSETEPVCRVTLFQCLPKVGKLELIVQKCTELGVHAVVPVVSARCVAQPTGNFEIKRVRYQRVAEEAAKQSRRGMIPAVGTAVPIEALNPAAFDLFIIAYEEERALTLRTMLRRKWAVKQAGVLIGPEGGLTPEEVALLTARGGVPVSLGARILRTETAGMAVLAQMLYELE